MALAALPVGEVEGDSNPVAAIIDALLEVTPEPPPVEAEPDEVLALGERMLAARESAFARLHAIEAAQRVLPATHAERYDLLLDRSTRWFDALTRARREMSDRAASARRLRTAASRAY